MDEERLRKDDERLRKDDERLRELVPAAKNDADGENVKEEVGLQKNATEGYPCVINPYALGEEIAGKKIDWDKELEPKKTLAEIMQIDEVEIFDAKNPILNPRIQIDARGGVKQLSDTEAQTRLESFLKERTQPIRRTLTRDLVWADARVKVPEILIPSVSVQSTNIPWNPSGTSWTDKGDFFKEVAELDDPIQGGLGDCYFIAALSSVALSKPYSIINAAMPSAYGNKTSPIHQIKFYKNKVAKNIEVSEAVPVRSSDKGWIYARSFDNGEIWPAVMEKAYAKWRTDNTTDFPNYLPIAGGWPDDASAELIGGTVSWKSHSNTSAEDLYTFVRQNSLGGRTFNPMSCWTYPSQPAGTNYNSANVVANHAYSVLGWDYYNNKKYIVLRNPWGSHHATLNTMMVSWLTSSLWGSKIEFVPMNTKGMFAMEIATFKQYFSGTGVAK